MKQNLPEKLLLLKKDTRMDIISEDGTDTAYSVYTVPLVL